MNNPTIYGFCPAGCKWETVHRNEFDASKSAYPIFEKTTDHTYHLINSDINLLAENPYKDITQNFKIYDGTKAPSSTNTWKVKLCGVVYVNGEATDTEEFEFDGRSQFSHELDLVIRSIQFTDNMQSVRIYINHKNSSGSYYLSLVCKPNDGDIVTCDLYVVNIGYPYTTEDGTTTEKVDGCENTRVYSIGYSKGFFSPTVESGISKNTVQQIGENVTGCKGYHITAISTPTPGDDGLYRISYTLDSTDKLLYSVGDVCTIRLDANYDNCGEIVSIAENVIEVKLYNKDISLLPTTLDDETTGDKNSFRVPLKPHIGNIDVGSYAVAFGNGNYATGAYSFASGYGNKAIGKYAFAEGFNNTAVYGGHVEGKNNEALGQQSHVEGWGNKATGGNSHVEGNSNLVTGTNSHIEGISNITESDNTHIEGKENHIKLGAISHVEGQGNILHNGSHSHIEGHKNQVHTWHNHMEGRENTSKHSTVHMEGMGNISTCNMQHVQGKYNSIADCSNMAHIVGGGTSDSDRKNIHTLDWNGNAWFEGTGEFDAIILRSSTAGSTKKFKIIVDDNGTLTTTPL